MHLKSPINREEVVAYVREKLLKQGERSMFNSSACAYHGPNGTRCAIGWLIDDDKYKFSFESLALSIIMADAVGWDLSDEDVKFLTGLQIIHDEYEPDTWDEYLTMKMVNQIMEREYK